MSTGALIFAFNNENTDYLELARWNARRIRRHLGIPVAVVTDCVGTRAGDFDRVITANSESGGARYFEDYGQSVSWYNANRTDAYSLTPWQQTLLLDADYVIDSPDLKTVLSAAQDFLCFRNAYNVSGMDSDALLPTFGRYRFPMWWATVIMFRKSVSAELIFSVMSMVKLNWQHYRDIYAIEKSPYRNDYALSIALALVNGHTLSIDSIPWHMASVLPRDDLEFDGDQWTVKFADLNSRPRRLQFNGMDFHAMGKKHLEQVLANHS